METPLISEIYRGSNVDGPGIRTVVFFKGCPLRCIWCHNPELQELEKEVLKRIALCIPGAETKALFPKWEVFLLEFA